MKDALKQDNYEVPVFPNQKFGAKNHAGLANCMTPVQSRNLLCPDETHRIDTLNYFQLFVKNAVDNGLNILLSSEELNHPELNMAELTSYLVPEYKIHVVLYYRRFYDWIHSIHNEIVKYPNHPKNRGHLTFAEWLTQDMSENFERLLFCFLYFWCQTSPVSPTAPDPVRILPDPGWFSGSRTSIEHLPLKV